NDMYLEFMKSAIMLDSLNSRNILMMGDDDLYYEDLVWDLDSEEEGATKREMIKSFPKAMFKITNKKYVEFFFFSVRCFEMSGDCEEWAKMYTFDKSGVLVDSITVSGHDLDFSDCLEVVFLNKNVFRLFHYKENPEGFVIRKNFFGYEEKEYLENEARSLCEITEYNISSKGKIDKTGWHDIIFLNDPLQMYFMPEINDDDPIKEYVK
ncbi:MAG: hypothetical protein K6E14_06045, partial [Paludibacteraceae bacterium]|nr:hypothetical protein [Paludibacteraceae bacterium]